MTRFASEDGQFHRVASKFRSSVSSDPSSEFPAEKDRYVLYLNLGCPWAHRTNIVRSLKGLEDVIQLVVMDWELGPDGWFYSGRDGTATEDPLYGFKFHKQLYEKADPEYVGRYTVPVLWDKKKETIVNNESSEIIRMLYSEFDEFVADDRKERTFSLLPADKVKEIDELNEWVYDLINNGVYKTGFAGTQEAYEKNIYPLFEALDRVEKILGDAKTSYLFGSQITEADIRLFPTIIRFDVAYYTLFKCNLRMIRHDYPHIHAWLKRLYWDENKDTNGAFKSTTDFAAVSDFVLCIANANPVRSREVIRQP
jgi:putative glutathione S-transferase